MKAFVSISFGNRPNMEKEVLTIRQVLGQQQIDSVVFVDQFQFGFEEEKQMMEQAKFEIEHCDFLIAECTEKAVGVGVEVGYARGKNKPVIYLRKKSAPHSTTISGISDYTILYENDMDLQQQLFNTLQSLQHLLSVGRP